MDAPSAAVAHPARLRSSPAWLLAAISVFVGSTSLLLFTIARPPDPYEALHFPRWMFYTIGPGKEALPVLQADLHAVYAADDKNVWVAGNNLFIAHSSDGGVTWQKSRVVVPELQDQHPTVTVETTTTPETAANTKPQAQRSRLTGTGLSSGVKKRDYQQPAPQPNAPPPASKPVKKSMLRMLMGMFEGSAYADTHT